MRRLYQLIFFLLISVSPATARDFNVRDFGASGDGVSLDSPAINAAIHAASKKKNSTVVIPSGVYKCFSIRLASNVTIRFEHGAVIKAAQYNEGHGFDAAEENPWWQYQDFGHSHWKNSLIWGIGLENIKICGPGLIDGSLLSNGVTQRAQSTDIDYDFTLVEGAGNKAISLKECRNVTLEGFTILRGGHFCILATGVEGMRVSGLKLDSNRDGIDIDCCRDVLVENCEVNTPWDDAIVLKSSFALGRYQDCENIIVRNCSISGYEVGTLLSGERSRLLETPYSKNPAVRSSGRIKLGTESSGGFRNVRVSDCSLEYCGGLHVESTDGGVVSDIRFNNITIDDCCDSPVFVMIGSRLRSPEGRGVGSISNVHFNNVVSRNARPEYGIIITGFMDKIVQDISFTDCVFGSRGGVSVLPSVQVPEIEKQYPDPKSFGTMPSKGAYFRHADNVRMNNVRFEFAEDDSRPLIIKEDVRSFSADTPALLAQAE